MAGSHLDCCFYYGVVIDKNDLHNIAVFDGCNAINEFLDKYEFDYRPIGSTSYSKKLIVGKEIHWDYGSYVTELTFSDGKIDLSSTLQLENNSVKIDNVLDFDNLKMKEKIKSAGIVFEPKYYIITSKE